MPEKLGYNGTRIHRVSVNSLSGKYHCSFRFDSEVSPQAHHLMTNLHQVKRQRSWLALKGALCIEERSAVPGGEQGQEGTSQSEGGLGLPMGGLWVERTTRQGE